MRLNLAKANQAKKGLYSGTKELVGTLKIDVTLAWCRRHVQNKVFVHENIVEAWCNDWIDAAELAYSIGGPQFCRKYAFGWILDQEQAQISSVESAHDKIFGGIDSTSQGAPLFGDFLHLEKAYRPNSWQPQNALNVRSLSRCQTTHKAKVMCSTR